MSQVKVKICGMSNLEDAIAAARLGADAIGLIFYAQSKRNIGIEAAQLIAKSLPPFVAKVGVFVNPEPEFLRQVLASVALDYLQFHGEESGEFCSSFKRAYIKTIHVGENKISRQVEKMYPDAAALLFDTLQQGTHGGTGKTFPWENLPHDLQKPIILSGGLTPENVVEAIHRVSAYGVDVASGVEQIPGRKDHSKMAAFIQNVLCGSIK